MRKKKSFQACYGSDGEPLEDVVECRRQRRSKCGRRDSMGKLKVDECRI